MKRCPDCGGEPKPLSDFYRSKRNRDGHGRLCKTCTYKHVRAWQIAHPEQVHEQQRRYRLKHSTPKPKRQPPTDAELRARRKESQRKYRRTHRKELSAWRRAYRKKHIRRIRAYYRNYYQENHDHLLELKAKYRQKRRAERNKKRQS
jgi:hypothetical protein